MTTTDLTAIPGITATPVGLVFADDDITVGAWEEYGARLARAEVGLMWAIGDWMAYGSDHYRAGEVSAIGDLLGFSAKTVSNAASVCRKVPLEVRREELSFGHHAVVAGRPVEEQALWLDLAAEEGLSRDELRARIAAGRTPSVPASGKPRRLPVRFNVTCPAGEVPQDVFQQGVHHAAVKLKEWLLEKGYETDIAEVL